MSVNSIVPDPVQPVDGRRERATHVPDASRGHSATTWIYFQVNPTNIGRRSENVVLEGGRGQRIVIHRSVVVLP